MSFVFVDPDKVQEAMDKAFKAIGEYRRVCDLLKFEESYARLLVAVYPKKYTFSSAVETIQANRAADMYGYKDEHVNSMFLMYTAGMGETLTGETAQELVERYSKKGE